MVSSKPQCGLRPDAAMGRTGPPLRETFEIPLGTVKSRLHTAVASFAQAWRAARVHEEGT